MASGSRAGSLAAMLPPARTGSGSRRREYSPAGVGDFRLPSAVVTTGRPVVRVLRDGRRIGSVRLRYRDGAFRGTWGGPKKPPGLIVFRLVSLTDGAGNSYL